MNYDFESKSSYSLTVTARDDSDAIGRTTATVELTDVRPPGAPAPPSVSSVSHTSVRVAWTLSAGAVSARVRYMKDGSAQWTEHPGDVSVGFLVVEGLASGSYGVQIQAVGPEGRSAWSQAGFGRTHTTGNSPPAFPNSIVREVSENQPPGTNVGAPVTATDAEGEVVSYQFPETSAFVSDFALDGTTGQLETNSVLDYEARQSYTLIVLASDGVDTTTVEMTVRILDEKEPPPTPGQPTVEPVDERATSLLATWVPVVEVDRPLVSGYDLQYRKEDDPDWKDGPQNVLFSRAEVGGLEPGFAYEVQVRAGSADGEGPWSDSGRGRTHGFTARVLSKPARHDAVSDFSVVFGFSEPFSLNGGDVQNVDNNFHSDRADFVSALELSADRLEVTFRPTTQLPTSIGIAVVGLGADCRPGNLCAVDQSPSARQSPLARMSFSVPGARSALLSVQAVPPVVEEGDLVVFEFKRSGDFLPGSLHRVPPPLVEGDPFVRAPPTGVRFQGGSRTATLSLETKKTGRIKGGGRILYRVTPKTSAPEHFPDSPAESRCGSRTRASATCGS